MRAMGVFGIVLLALHGVANADVTDFFDSYSLYTWPSPYWVAVSTRGSSIRR
jgi:hypothetical protein